MEINILQQLDGAKAAEGVAVIIDVFRAFTVECYLIENGAEAVIPVGDKKIAYDYKKSHPTAVLIGERRGIKLDGFDYGNSPSQIENVDFSGKTVIHTTSAGTQGIANSKSADKILVASLVNAKATAEYIKMLNPEKVSLVCMGLNAEKETKEDTLCAEYIKSIIFEKPIDLTAEIEQVKRTDGAKFFDKDMQWVFPEKDFYLSTDADKFPFALEVEKGENGMFFTRKKTV